MIEKLLMEKIIEHQQKRFTENIKIIQEESLKVNKQ